MRESTDLFRCLVCERELPVRHRTYQSVGSGLPGDPWFWACCKQCAKEVPGIVRLVRLSAAALRTGEG